MTSEAVSPTAAAAVRSVDAQMRRVRRARFRRRAVMNLLRLLIAAAVVGSWQLCARTGVVDPFFYGEPSGVVSQIRTWMTDGTSQGTLWTQISVTLEEALFGFVLGVLSGVIAGIVLGRLQLLAELLAPFIKALNAIPRIVLGSLFIVMFGLGMTSKVLLAVVLVFFSVFFNAFQGTRDVNRNLMANAKILGASSWQTTTRVVLPSALTWILASLHVSFGFALIGAIVGEFLGADKGLGLLIRTSQGTFNANGVLAAMLIMAVVALIAEGIFTQLERRLLRWQPYKLAGLDR